MKLLVLSDLHVEATPFIPVASGHDVVVLAGDIHNGTRAVRWARSTFPHDRIVQIAGNHEFYDGRYDECLDQLRESASRLDIALLENESVVIDTVQFLGCTLWSDFEVFDRADRPERGERLTAQQAMTGNLRLMADYQAIELDDPVEGPRLFGPEDACRLHCRSRDWLRAALALRPPAAACARVVVTHHLPSWHSVSERYAQSITNAAFVSDLDDLVERADLWIHGHTHSSHDYRIGASRVVCNPRGYPLRRRNAAPGMFENPRFDPARVIEVPGC